MSLPFTGGGRRCGTCRFYRSSPIPGQGWCTHPELVKPPAMVLVKSRELNCARPLSEIPDRWEPADPRHEAPPVRPSMRIRAVTPASLAPQPVSETAPPTSSATAPFERPPLASPPTTPLGEADSHHGPADGPSSDGEPTASFQQSGPFPPQTERGSRWVVFVALPIALCLVLGMIGATVFVATDGFGAGRLGSPAPTATRPAGIAGTAKQDFRLRSEARSDSEQRSVVRSGTRLQLINSAAGEILDPSLPEPAKWYLVQTADGSARGWAYSGWIERQS